MVCTSNKTAGGSKGNRRVCVRVVSVLCAYGCGNAGKYVVDGLDYNGSITFYRWFIPVLCGPGKMAHATPLAATNDPIFWVSHSGYERIWSWLRLKVRPSRFRERERRGRGIAFTSHQYTDGTGLFSSNTSEGTDYISSSAAAAAAAAASRAGARGRDDEPRQRHERHERHVRHERDVRRAGQQVHERLGHEQLDVRRRPQLPRPAAERKPTVTYSC